MKRFLLGANLSHRNATFLNERYGFDAVDLNSLDLGQYPDLGAIELAVTQGRIIVSEDQHFGEHFAGDHRGRVGIILLRHKNQSVQAANESLARLFDNPENADIPFERSLVIVDRNKVRVRS